MIGSRVRIPSRSMQAIVKFIGPTHLGEGLFFGIEVDPPNVGDHDGQIDNTRYFRCMPGRGLIIRANEATLNGVPCDQLLSDSYVGGKERGGRGREGETERERERGREEGEAKTCHLHRKTLR